MKLKDLLSRRKQLQEEKGITLKEIGKLAEDLEWKDLQKFIATGDVTSVNGHDLSKLQKKHKHLDLLEGSLSREIVKAAQSEKGKVVAKLTREADSYTTIRVKLLSRIKHHLVKANQLQEDVKLARTEETRLRREAHLKEKATNTVTKRLCEMEEFLKDNVILGSKLEEAVLTARKSNKGVLNQSRIGSEEEIQRNFIIEWDSDSLEIVKLDLLTQNAQSILMNYDKGKLIEEVC